MDDDMDTPQAIASLFNLLRLANTHIATGRPDTKQLSVIKKAIEDMLWILGIEEERADLESRKAELSAFAGELDLAEGGNSNATLELIIDAREKARAAKDFKRSDLIRQRLKDMGILLEDKKGAGSRWKVASTP